MISDGLDATEVEQVISYARLSREDAERVIGRVFEPMSPTPPFFSVRRYGDGGHPVLYTAMEQTTAQDEVVYYLEGSDWIKLGHPIFKDVFTVSVAGRAKDLRHLRAEAPELTSNDYGRCWELGRQAHTTSIDILLCPSARSPGNTAPVFSRDAVGKVEVTSHLRFEWDDGLNRVRVTAF